MSDEAQLRRVIDGWTRNLRARDIDALCFEAGPHDRAHNLDRWFALWPGSADRDVRCLEITGNGSACCELVSHVDTGARVQAMLGLNRIAGEWQVTQERIWRLPPPPTVV